MSMEDAIRDLTYALGSLEREWEDHDCHRESGVPDADKIESDAYEKGFYNALQQLLDDVETWKRQTAVGLVTGTLTLDGIEDWLRRKK